MAKPRGKYLKVGNRRFRKAMKRGDFKRAHYLSANSVQRSVKRRGW